MDFKDAIKQLGDRVTKLKSQVLTEEATKNAFIMPFIKELGYDVFNPLEVIPEFVADIGIKQGEKIDYAIIKDGAPIILIECKCHTGPLNVHNASQLFRYFHATKAKFSILTNGIEYRFYTDLVEPNRMDEKPFFVFDIAEMKDTQIEELKKFHKTNFDFTKIVNTASELKYTNELKLLISQELNNPSPDFVKYFARQIYPGVVTQKIVDQFTELTKKSFTQYINDIITDRLKSALTKEAENQKLETTTVEDDSPLQEDEPKIFTTQEEIDGFLIVKSILRQIIPVHRIVYRDAQSYFSILLDDNNRKTICRLYFNGAKKQVGLFDSNKKESKVEILSLDDLYAHSSTLLDMVRTYDNKKVSADSEIEQSRN
ncbi:restriction endonuclease [Chitinophaga varians]|uniref:Restriction endonuclease n=1 Tax=Chitinophaga varians TaxID=2202339 RepID=A0A847RK26_9BACT|nr:type I restriction endonuclease [Chitinophaga varians]NLR63322.1 restriction endonuclease [Chitinophaga varians]